MWGSQGNADYDSWIIIRADVVAYTLWGYSSGKYGRLLFLQAASCCAPAWGLALLGWMFYRWSLAPTISIGQCH